MTRKTCYQKKTFMNANRPWHNAAKDESLRGESLAGTDRRTKKVKYRGEKLIRRILLKIHCVRACECVCMCLYVCVCARAPKIYKLPTVSLLGQTELITLEYKITL